MIRLCRALIGSVLCCSLMSIAVGKEVNVSLDLSKGVARSGQQVIKVKKNDQVHIVLTSDEPGDLHLHAYHLSVHLSPNKKSVLDFKAFATGRFPFEWHSELTQSASPMSHHKPTSTLEVFPE